MSAVVGACVITAVLAFLAGWVVCWAVAMRYGEHAGRFQERRARDARPMLAYVALPAGIKQAQVVPAEPDQAEELELISTWASHRVVEG